MDKDCKNLTLSAISAKLIGRPFEILVEINGSHLFTLVSEIALQKCSCRGEGRKHNTTRWFCSATILITYYIYSQRKQVLTIKGKDQLFVSHILSIIVMVYWLATRQLQNSHHIPNHSK